MLVLLPRALDRFFPTFRGEASRDVFAAAGYNAYGLAWRDLTAGVTSSDPTGATLLTDYLAGVRARDPKLPLATVTNFELDDNDPLKAHVVPHTLVALDGGRVAAFLSVVDPQHVTPLNPHYGNKLLPYLAAITREIWMLQRLPPGPGQAQDAPGTPC